MKYIVSNQSSRRAQIDGHRGKLNPVIAARSCAPAPNRHQPYNNSRHFTDRNPRS